MFFKFDDVYCEAPKHIKTFNILMPQH